MRRFTVWLDKMILGVDTVRELVEMPDCATDEQCNVACRETLDVMIGNELDAGWDELEPGEEPPSD